MPPNQQPYGDPNYPGALVVAPQQSNPYAQAQAPVPPYAQQQGYDPNYGQATYGMPQPAAPVDPFSVFESAPAPAPVFNGPPSTSTAMVPAAPAAAAATGDDFWSNFTPAQAVDNLNITDSPIVVDEKKTEEGLPEGGEWYDARIFTPTLGVMFFKPQELTDSLFLNTDKELVDSLGDRPVVAFIVEGSSARSAGVELGHVLVKVNGQDVRNPKEASRLIKEGPRPLPLLFYVPATDVVTAEGEHMVKYDTKETIAPNSAKEWKPKYVVIGGIIAQPWMMNMYRSKVSILSLRLCTICVETASDCELLIISLYIYSPSTILPSLRHKHVVLSVSRSNSLACKELAFRMIGKDRKWSSIRTRFIRGSILSSYQWHAIRSKSRRPTYRSSSRYMKVFEEYCWHSSVVAVEETRARQVPTVRMKPTTTKAPVSALFREATMVDQRHPGVVSRSSKRSQI
jgi:hypothetical protein